MRGFKNIPGYAVAICPDDDGVREVALLKHQLYKAISWFGSYRSLAHITIDKFDCSASELDLRIQLIRSFASGCQNQMLTFNSIKWFNEGQTIYIAPDASSQDWLKALGKSYFKFMYKRTSENFNPHLTIGRKIKPEYYQEAQRVFHASEVSLRFECSNIALRKFNPARGQYDIVQRFNFAV